MQSIWKFTLDVIDSQSIRVPRGARFLSMQIQGGRITLWLAVTPSEPVVSVPLQIIGTGWEVERVLVEHFLGTVQMGGLVWHVFGDFGQR